MGEVGIRAVTPYDLGVFPRLNSACDVDIVSVDVGEAKPSTVFWPTAGDMASVVWRVAGILVVDPLRGIGATV